MQYISGMFRNYESCNFWHREWLLKSEVDNNMVCASLFSKKLTYAALTAVFKSLESPIDYCREFVDPVFP